MIERVAAKLADFYDDGLNVGAYLPAARAAIEAMREPTDEILEAANDVVVGYDDFAIGDGTIYLGLPGYPPKATEAWHALIDAALNEQVAA